MYIPTPSSVWWAQLQLRMCVGTSCAGRHMYIATWFVQYSYLFIGIIGSIILTGESLKVQLKLFLDYPLDFFFSSSF